MKFSFANPPPVITAPLPELEGVTLQVRAPTLAERLHYRARLAGERDAAWLELFQFVTGWSGVENESGAAVPFNPETLRRLLCHERFFWPALAALTDVFADAVTADQAKN